MRKNPILLNLVENKGNSYFYKNPKIEIMKNQQNIFALFLLCAALVVSCKSDKKEKKTDEEMVVEEPEIIEEVETDVIIIDEHHFEDFPLTSHGEKVLAGTAEKDETPEVHKVKASKDLHVDLVANDYVSKDIEISEAIIPLDDTQTIVSYNKKNEQIGMFQVVADADGEIQKIAFVDKRHKDKYDVQNGMTAKEVRQLRRRLKHVMKKTDHYLYDDQSNIMYLLNITDEKGNEITEAEIDKAEVRAIIWQPKDKESK